jgi:hypothetical protein
MEVGRALRARRSGMYPCALHGPPVGLLREVYSALRGCASVVRDNGDLTGETTSRGGAYRNHQATWAGVVDLGAGALAPGRPSLKALA